MTLKEKEPTMSDEKLLPCRKCGHLDYEMWDGTGTQARLECNSCGSLEEIQWSDQFDYGDPLRHAPFIDENYTCHPDVIRITKAALIEEWNIRSTSSWLDISLAPKDGTPIVIFEYRESADWCSDLYPDGVPTATVVFWSKKQELWAEDCSSYPEHKPTHFQHLPTPPRE